MLLKHPNYEINRGIGLSPNPLKRKSNLPYVQAPAQQNHSWGGGGDTYRVPEATARSKS